MVHAESLQWYMSTTMRDANDTSLVFAENHGPDKTLVYDGSATMSTQATGSPGGPRDFDYTLDLQAPFFYDPSQGNLVIDFIFPSGFTPIGFEDDQVSGGYRYLAEIPYSGAETGFRLGVGPIMQFTFAADPSSSAADFNSDGNIDGSDFLMWQRGESTEALSTSDLANWEQGLGLRQ